MYPFAYFFDSRAIIFIFFFAGRGCGGGGCVGGGGGGNPSYFSNKFLTKSFYQEE